MFSDGSDEKVMKSTCVLSGDSGLREWQILHNAKLSWPVYWLASLPGQRQQNADGCLFVSFLISIRWKTFNFAWSISAKNWSHQKKARSCGCPPTVCTTPSPHRRMPMVIFMWNTPPVWHPGLSLMPPINTLSHSSFCFLLTWLAHSGSAEDSQLHLWAFSHDSSSAASED